MNDGIDKFLKQNFADEPVKYRINLFNAVRNFKYQVNNANTPEKLLEYRAGYCVSKHRLLKVLYDSLGYQTRLAFISFRFSDIYLPEDLKNWGFANKKWYHVFLQIFLNNAWIDIDASFNGDLSEYYAVNRNRDGFSSQKVIVNYVNPIFPQNKEEENKAKLDLSDASPWSEKDNERVSKFNEWLLFLETKKD